MRRFICLLMILITPLGASAVEKTNAAKIHVAGYGLFGNLQLKKSLKMLERAGQRPAFYTADYIEDAALILLSRVGRDGFLRGRVSVELTLTNGAMERFTWDGPIREPLPRTLMAKKVAFQIEKGPLFYYDKIRFEGLHALKEKQARHFFVETDALLPSKKNKVFTPQKLRHGIDSFQETLERAGYEHALVTATNIVRNEATGAVSLDVQVSEGRKVFVQSVTKQVIKEGEPTRETITSTNAVYSRLWMQDYIQKIKSTFYTQGYADAKVEVVESQRVVEGELERVNFVAKITPGKAFTTGAITFEGQKETKESMMRRRVRIEPQDPLDPIAAERGRYRLARLGIFDSVELEYKQVDEDTRDLLYRVKEGKQMDFSLLAGYGSYEQLRGGFDFEQFNVFGRGHHSHLRMVQSFKSSSGDYLYTMPELVGRDLDVFFNANALRREEISFTRQEFGASAGVRRMFKPIATDISARYSYQILDAVQPDLVITNAVQNAHVGAFIFDIKHDLRDNPLVPRRGYKIFTTLELASEYLAGDVNYQRFESSASYHLPIGEGHWLHFGMTHGFVTTVDAPQKDLPFNKRFFPGGESSVRGYQLGEAAPKNAQGKIVGAETFVLGNFEVEQALTRTWSLVGFVDAVGFAESLSGYPFTEGLVSVGGGLSWKTLIGPARLEYGYNLRRRESDPMGTLHFSVGFPF